MSGKAKIEALTNAFYGFAVFEAGLNLLRNGIGFFSLIFGAFGLLTSFIITWWVGRSLVKGSGLMRAIAIVVGGLGAVGNLYATGKLTLSLTSSFSLSTILEIVAAAAAAYMGIRSFKTLALDAAVRAHFR